MARKASTKPKLYVVQRLSWTVWDNDGMFCCSRRDNDEGVPLRAFRKRADAEAYQKELTRVARSEVSPFYFESGELELLTSLEEEELTARLNELNIRLPDETHRSGSDYTY